MIAKFWFLSNGEEMAQWGTQSYQKEKWQSVGVWIDTKFVNDVRFQSA